MHKNIYFIDTKLASNLGYGDNLASIEQPLWDKLRSSLLDDDWIYIQISFAGHTEVVKVVGSIPPNILVLVRGQDNTVRGAFPIGSAVKYVQTVAGILDTFSPPKLNINTLGAIRYNDGKVSIPNINLIGLGGMGIPNSAALRCCPVDTAPKIPLDLQPLRIDSVGNVRLTSDDEYRVWR